MSKDFMSQNVINPMFSKWSTGFSGCDGGDIGDRSNRGIWLCGIEWGGGHEPNVDALSKLFEEDVDSPYQGYKNWKDNLAYIYNWQAMKLLAAIDGQSATDYKKFAEEKKPFIVGSKGYFKMNLYPLAFRNTSHTHWEFEFSQATGFQDKNGYLDSIRSNRFPAIRTWAANHAPKLIVCTGITYQGDFHRAFGDESMTFITESIDDRQLSYGFNEQGTLVVVIPFMVNRNGLTRNVSIQKFGDRIKTLLP